MPSGVFQTIASTLPPGVDLAAARCQSASVAGAGLTGSESAMAEGAAAWPQTAILTGRGLPEGAGVHAGGRDELAREMCLVRVAQRVRDLHGACVRARKRREAALHARDAGVTLG